MSRREQVIGVGVITLLLGACTIQVPAPDPPPAPVVATPSSTAPSVTPSPSESPSDETLARSVVRLTQLDGSGEPVCSAGSGTIVGDDGTILTNFHVVANPVGTDCEYQQLGVSITDSTASAPTLAYTAEVYAADPEVDLAVVRITGTATGNALNQTFPALPVGDSDAVKFGAHIRVLGYPGIGGDTVTLTEGTVSGFLPSPEIDGVAWIKTATTIAGGNSGGAALDDEGALIGVPTQARAGDGLDVADCRIVQDTNGDGELNDDDTCIPIGGFLNGLRPVRLAAPLLQQARTASPIPFGELTYPETAVAADDAGITSIAFGPDVTVSNEPTELAVSMPSGSPRLCAFFDYTGMVDGTAWDALWTVDGEVNEAVSLRGQSWYGGSDGSWWVCSPQSGPPLDDGLWEFSVYVSSAEPIATDSIYVGDDHPPADLHVVNGLGDDVCRLYVSPNQARTWGQDDLGPETLPMGETVTVTVGAASYDVRAELCTTAEPYLRTAVAVDGDTQLVLQ